MESERLKAAVWYTIGKICEHEAKELNVIATPQLIASLTEIVYSQAETLAKDVELFARHAKRSTVTMDDIKLAARRNESFLEIISNEAEDIAQRTKEDKEAKRRKK